MQSPWYRSLSVNFFIFHFALFYLIQTGSSVRVSTGRVVCMRIFHTCHISNCDGLNPFRTKWSHTYVCTIYIIHMYYVPDLVLIPYYILTIEYIFVPNWVHCRSQWSRIYSSWITTIPIDVTLCDRIIQTSIEFIAITRWDYNHWLLPSI